MGELKILTPKLEKRFKQTEDIISDFDRLSRVLTQQDTGIEIIEDKKLPNGDKLITIKITEEDVIISAMTNKKDVLVGICVTFPSKKSFLLNQLDGVLSWEDKSIQVPQYDIKNKRVEKKVSTSKNDKTDDIDRLSNLLEDEDISNNKDLYDLEQRLIKLQRNDEDDDEDIVERKINNPPERLIKLLKDPGSVDESSSKDKDKEPSLEKTPPEKSESYDKPVFDETFVQNFKQADKTLGKTISTWSEPSEQDIETEAKKVYQEIYGEEAPKENKTYDIGKGAFKQMQLRYFIEDIRDLCNKKPQKIDDKKPRLLQSESGIFIPPPALSV